MNILVVSSYLPYPLHSGGEVRLYNLLKRLAKNHTITLVCEIRSHQTKEDINEVAAFCKEVITLPRKKQWSLQTILKTAASSHSFLVTGHTLPRMKRTIAELLASGGFDLIHVETSYVMQNVPETSVPIVLTEHNIEYSVYEKYAVTKPKALKKLLQIDIKKLRIEEESFWKRANKVICVSEEEWDVVMRVTNDVAVVPNGVDTHVFKKKEMKKVFENEKRLLYIGNYKWIQNQNALRFILQDVWPSIEKQTDSSVKFVVIGRDLPTEFQQYASNRVIIEGVSQKPSPEIFSEAFALLAPLKVAGGTQYKILEALAVGTPVITTKLGMAGLAIKNDETLLIGEKPKELVDQTMKLLRDKTLYEKLAKNGRELIEKHFSFDAIAEELDKVYHGVVGRRPS